MGKPAAKSSALPWILGGIAAVMVLGFGAVVLLLLAVANAGPEPPALSTRSDPDSGPRLEVPTAVATLSGSAVSARPRLPSTGSLPPATFRPSPPPTPAQPVQPTVLGAFPRARATNELDRVAAGLASCKRAGDPTGSGSIRVDFEPDGSVGTQLGSPFSGTSTGSCITSRFSAIRVGPFTGTTQQLSRGFTIGSAPSPSF